MIDTESVRRALGSLERFAPAETEVLAGFRAGVVRRRRRRQLASKAGVTAAAAAVALGVVVVVAPDRGPVRVAAPPASSTAPEPTVAIANPPAPPALPFTVGWVPDGYTLDAWGAGSADSSAQYVGTKDLEAVVVSISTQPREVIEGATREPIEIAGLTGVLQRLPQGDDVQLIWRLADGRWAMVGGMSPPVPLDALRRVAENLSTEPTPVTVPWSLSTVPEGYRVARWSGGALLHASLTMCPGETQEPAVSCVGVTVQEGTAPAVTQRKNRTAADAPTDKETVIDVPVDQELVVDGVRTRATADGTLVYAQLDPEHWVSVYSEAAGVDMLREVAASAVVG
jgi:hypothetical protein